MWILLACLGWAQPAWALPKAPEWARLVDFESGGVQRSAYVHVPAGSDGKGLPVILMFHGGSGEHGLKVAKHWEDYQNKGYVLVFPNGQQERPDNVGWYPFNGDPDEHVKFVRALVGQLEKHLGIDPTRVYAAGYSNGAYMVHHLICDAGDLFAGFAPAAQTLDLEQAKDCSSPPKPLIWFLGTEDPKSWWHGKLGTMSAEQTADFWIERGGCDRSQVERSTLTTASGAVCAKIEHYGQCARGGPFRFVTVVGGAHVWPRADATPQGACVGLDAADQAVDFWNAAGGR